MTHSARSTGERFTAQPFVLRTMAAAFVGLLLPPLVWAITQAGLAVIPYDGSGGNPGWGRFGQGVGIVAGVVLFSLVMTWPSLWALRVRPAWHVALPAPIVGIVFGIALTTVASQIIGNPLTAASVALALAYGLTALLTTPGRPWWWQQLPLMAVGGPPPIPMAAPRSRLPDLEIPLIAPDLPAYTIERLSTRPGGLRYLLRPSALHRAATPAERDASTIAVTVRSRVDPPGEDSAYEPAGPRTWRRATDTGTTYVIDRDDATIIVKAGPRVPAAILLQATTTLQPRPPSHFTTGP
ncbi:hypothetical protein GCM10022252_04040 [Streptosporangium oxazolinicum]|uniref:Uncharacterized protein n=1 Tax=Streptosporangium oxazolinicum TaxID=909287 RepID=A0ABP8AAP3_9ACTN